jgi:hypothetical protein
MTFNVGDIVTMSLVCLKKIKNDEYEIEHNPIGELGVVEKVWFGLHYDVMWGSGIRNTYLEGDLDLYVIYEPYTDSDLEEMIG